MYHCKPFKSSDLWVLEGNKEFFNRLLYIGFCPVCNKLIAELQEVRKVDGKKFTDRKVGIIADKLIRREKHNIIFKRSTNKFKRVLFGWRYGVTTVTNNFHSEFAVDFYGQKELIRTKVKTND